MFAQARRARESASRRARAATASSRPSKNSQIACAIASPSSVPGPAPHLVDQQQRAPRAAPQDIRRLGHLHVERRLPRREIVAGTDARKDAIDGPELHRLRRNERADLRHDRQQAGLPQIRGLATHVRARQQHETPLADAHVEIVRHELGVEDRLHHGVTPVFDGDEALIAELGPHVAAFGGALRERGEHVDLGDRFGGREKLVGSSRRYASTTLRRAAAPSRSWRACAVEIASSSSFSSGVT